MCGYVGKIAGRGQSVEEGRQDSTSDRADFLIGACTFARGVIVLHLPLLERTYQTPTIQQGPSASSTQGSIRTPSADWAGQTNRSEESRVGNECARPCSSRRSPIP